MISCLPQLIAEDFSARFFEIKIVIVMQVKVKLEPDNDGSSNVLNYWLEPADKERVYRQ